MTSRNAVGTLYLFPGRSPAAAVPLVSDVMYFAAVGFAVFVYLKGRRLSKNDEKREACELIGAAGFMGLFGALLALTVLRP